MAEKAQLQTNATGPLTTEEILAAEARAIHGDAADGASGKVNSELYRELNGLNSAALCLSGGGIRSAAFALGVIQALATHPRPLGAPNKPVDSENNSLLAQVSLSLDRVRRRLYRRMAVGLGQPRRVQVGLAESRLPPRRSRCRARRISPGCAPTATI